MKKIVKENIKLEKFELPREEALKLMDEYFRVLNYLSVAQLYLLDNPLLRRPLEINDIKPNVVGHFGTAPGQNFIYTHLNRVINKYDLDMIYLSGPGHGGNAIVSHVYLEGSYSDIYPHVSLDEKGMKKLFKQFSFPGGISSHVAPETPGSINEGGELGYSLAHAAGAVLDNKELIAACFAKSKQLYPFIPLVDADILDERSITSVMAIFGIFFSPSSSIETGSISSSGVSL